MTTTARIERSSGNCNLGVFVEIKDADGNWIRQPEFVKLEYAADLHAELVHGHQRIVIEETSHTGGRFPISRSGTRL